MYELFHVRISVHLFPNEHVVRTYVCILHVCVNVCFYVHISYVYRHRHECALRLVCHNVVECTDTPTHI